MGGSQARKTLLVICILISHRIEGESSGPSGYKISGIQCQTLDTSIVTISECFFDNVTETLQQKYDLQRPVAEMHLLAEFKLKATKTTMYRLMFDLCDFMKNRRKTIVRLVYSFFSNYTNFNHTCPYEDSIILRNLPVVFPPLPVPFPKGSYILRFTYTVRKRPTLQVDYYIEAY